MLNMFTSAILPQLTTLIPAGVDRNYTPYIIAGAGVLVIGVVVVLMIMDRRKK